MPVGRKFYYSVPGLLIPEDAPNDLSAEFELFVETAPALTEELRQNVAMDDVTACYNNLDKLYTMVQKLYARKIETCIENAMHTLRLDFDEISRTTIPEIISDIITLSIDIQTTQSNEELERIQSENMVSLYANAIQNLMAVQTLANNMENERALRLLHKIEAVKNFENHKDLRQALLHRKFTNAQLILENIIDRVYGLLLSLGGDVSGQTIQKKILAVDDRPEILTTVTNILKGLYQVFGATSGQAALAIIEKQKPDLFILDIEMPGMDGYELIRRIKLKEEFKDTPFIFLTSNCDKAYVLKAIRSGANDFIVKPINNGLLATKVIQVLYNVNIQ